MFFPSTSRSQNSLIESAPGNLQLIPIIAIASSGYAWVIDTLVSGANSDVPDPVMTPLTWSANMVALTSEFFFAIDWGTASVPMGSMRGFAPFWFDAEVAVDIVEYQSAGSPIMVPRARRAVSSAGNSCASVLDRTRDWPSKIGLKCAWQVSRILRGTPAWTGL